MKVIKDLMICRRYILGIWRFFSRCII